MVAGSAMTIPPEVSKLRSISTDPPESIELSEIVELRRMLQDEEFVRLNSVLYEFQNIFEKDQTIECKHL